MKASSNAKDVGNFAPDSGGAQGLAVGKGEEGQRMYRASSRRLDKRWFLIVAVVLVTAGVITKWMGRSITMTNKDGNAELASTTAVPVAQNEDAPSEKIHESDKSVKESTIADIAVSEGNAGGGRPERVPKFEKSVEEYNTLTRELDVELAAYRASTPVFANFLAVVTDKVVPLAIEGEKAALWLSDAKGRGVHNYYENSDYDKKTAEEAMVNIAEAIYGDVYSQFQKAIDAGQLSLSTEQQKVYYLVMSSHFKQIAERISGPLKGHYPYEEGSLEHYLFARELGQAIIMATSPLGKMILQVPPELEEKQREVNEFYERLDQQRKQSGIAVMLPDKFKEVYLKRLEEEFQKIGQISELVMETRRMQKQMLDDEQIMDDALDALDEDIQQE